ncbi:hypothetical protein BDY24DRAFT_396200 [Mrakia frigida]|uniref:oxygenase MpaB family protein n=1 Tax=Mrakia frigida TaxID=29902 RepID=UPI003FCC0983
MVFLLPPLPRNPDPSTFIHLERPSQTDDFRNGDLITTWERLFQWDDDCVPASELAALSKLADPLVDDFLSSLPPPHLAHKDLLQLLFEEATKEKSRGLSEKGLALRLWEEVAREAPEGVKASEADVELGQRVFWGNVGGIFAGLMHFSLAGGFSSPRITASLHKASYLIPPSSADAKYLPITAITAERTLSRLYETGQFVLDVMGSEIPVPDSAPDTEKLASSLLTTSGLAGLSPPLPSSSPSFGGAGEGWKSAVRVRLLHGVVRRRIQMKDQRTGEGFDEETGETIVPINVEEVVGTLSSFAVAPLWTLETMGVTLNAAEKDAYLRTWRHIGFYLGVPSPLLSRHFSLYTPSSKFLASIVCHLFPSPPPTGSPSSIVLGEQNGVLPPPTMAILDAISNRPPMRTTLEYHQNMTRFLVGDSLADYLGVPRPTMVGSLRLRLSVLLLTYGTHFGNAYPSRRWRDTRIRLMRDGIGRMLRMGMGKRKSAFRPREEGSGMLSEEAKEEEGVRMDPVGAYKMVREYQLLVAEMVVVSLSALVGASVVSFVVLSKLRSASGA